MANIVPFLLEFYFYFGSIHFCPRLVAGICGSSFELLVLQDVSGMPRYPGYK
jgi:hypothetical protein